MKKLAVLIAGAALAFGAQAASVSYSFGTPTLGLETTEISQTGSLGLFDSTLGTLTGATITLYGAADTVISLGHSAAQDTNVRGTTAVDLSFSSSLGSMTALLSALSINLTMATGNQMLASTPSGFNYTSGVITDADSVGPTSVFGAAGLSAAGGGTFSISCASDSSLAVGWWQRQRPWHPSQQRCLRRHDRVHLHPHPRERAGTRQPGPAGPGPGRCRCGPSQGPLIGFTAAPGAALAAPGDQQGKESRRKPAFFMGATKRRGAGRCPPRARQRTAADRAADRRRAPWSGLL